MPRNEIQQVNRILALARTVLGLRKKAPAASDTRIMVPPHPGYRVPLNYVGIGRRPNIIFVPVVMN